MAPKKSTIVLNVEQFIRDVEERPAIWNRNFHCNKAFLEQMWDELSTEHKLPKVVLKAKWKGLRDNFRVEYKRIPRTDSGEFLIEPAAFESKWIHYYALLFLTEHMRHRTPKNEQDQSYLFSQQSQDTVEKTVVEPDLTNGLIRRLQDSDEDFDEDDIDEDEEQTNLLTTTTTTTATTITTPTPTITTTIAATTTAITTTKSNTPTSEQNYFSNTTNSYLTPPTLASSALMALRQNNFKSMMERTRSNVSNVAISTGIINVRPELCKTATVAAPVATNSATCTSNNVPQTKPATMAKPIPEQHLMPTAKMSTTNSNTTNAQQNAALLRQHNTIQAALAAFPLQQFTNLLRQQNPLQFMQQLQQQPPPALPPQQQQGAKTTSPNTEFLMKAGDAARALLAANYMREMSNETFPPRAHANNISTAHKTMEDDDDGLSRGPEDLSNNRLNERIQQQQNSTNQQLNSRNLKRKYTKKQGDTSLDATPRTQQQQQQQQQTKKRAVSSPPIYTKAQHTAWFTHIFNQETNKLLANNNNNNNNNNLNNNNNNLNNNNNNVECLESCTKKSLKRPHETVDSEEELEIIEEAGKSGGYDTFLKALAASAVSVTNPKTTTQNTNTITATATTTTTTTSGTKSLPATLYYPTTATTVNTLPTTTTSIPQDDDDYCYLLSLYPYMKALTAVQKLRIRTKIQAQLLKELYKEDLDNTRD